MGELSKQLRLASWKARMHWHTYWERTLDPRPTTLDQLPPAAESLTTGWLTQAMCKGVPGAQVTSITLGAKSVGSTDRRAFTVTYNAAGTAAGLPEHLFFKCATAFHTRMILLMADIRENEAGFYRAVRPQLEIEVPKAYFADVNLSSLRLAIVLDDITVTKGARFVETTQPVTREHIEAQLDILANYHATFWNSPKLDREFTWLHTPLDYANHVRDFFDYKRLGKRGTDRAEHVIPRALLGRDDAVWKAYMRSMESCSKPPFTFLHGDPHVRNFYVTRDGTLGLVDWGTTMKGNWSYDYPYTLCTSLEVEDRRKWEKELLAHYLDRLKAHGLKEPPGFDQAWETYRRQTLYAYYAWLVTLGFTEGTTQMQPDDASLDIIRRTAAAVDDLDSVKLQSD